MNGNISDTTSSLTQSTLNTPPVSPGDSSAPAASSLQSQPSGTYNSGSPPEIPKIPKSVFTVTTADTIASAAVLFIGYFYVKYSFIYVDWYTGLFAWMFAAVVLTYSFTKGVTPPKASWFWLAMFLLPATTYFFWTPSPDIFFQQGALIFCSAVYWVASLNSGLLRGKTSNLLLLDGINILFAVPLFNFGLLLKALFHPILALFRKRKSADKGNYLKHVFPIAVGVLLTLLSISIVFPLLLSADSGGFAAVLEFVTLFNFVFNFDDFLSYFGVFILSIPVSMYMFSIIAGFTRKHNTQKLKKTGIEDDLPKLQLIPYISSVILLVSICLLYIVFILSQTPHYFSAFFGNLPGNFTSHSSYARNGFFELCRVSAINLGFLAVVLNLTKIGTGEPKLLRWLTLLLCDLTLLLIATAFSKMYLYIITYGLTPKRIITSAFMLFLAAVCIAVSMLHRRRFSILRFSLVLGAALLCLLCIVNLDYIVYQFNEYFGYIQTNIDLKEQAYYFY